ncbi:MAG: UDP-galactopyranose mutase [Verrucomicrobiota bacterium]
MTWDYLIVGAGFAGAVLAERLASQMGAHCLVVDRRNHIGGNAHDHYDKAGVLIHTYGPHYFRTNSQRIVTYLSQFTEWHKVDYTILSSTHGRLWPFPINLNTFEKLLGRASSTEEMEATLAEWRVQIDAPQNSEEMVLSQVGRQFYEMFFKNYTRKQWGRDARQLDASVCGRIPLRKFQALPKDGYTAMFKRMLEHPGIEVRLGCDYREVRRTENCRHLIYTGPIDEYFDYCHGRLPYRSLRFEAETLDQEYFQPVVQVNYPNDHVFTRIVEIKHATGQKIPVTTIVREYPEEFAPGKEPYYPVPAPDARTLYERYALLAQKEPWVSFVGRLATYRYYNMDQVIGAALAEFETLQQRYPRKMPPERTLGPAFQGIVD